MARWVPMQLVGAAYADDALPWTHQDTVNYIPVPAEKEGVRSSAILRCLPGLVPLSSLGTDAPIRGMRNVEGRLFVVSGSSLFSVAKDGTATTLGTIPGVARCSMSHNQVAGGNQVVISNGQAGYIYNTATSTFSQITDDGFPGAISFDFVDGYILGIDPTRRQAFTSDLTDAASYNTIDEYQAEGSPDLLVGQAVTHREWWLMGERTIEPFINTGAATGTFQRAEGTVIEVGLASTHAVAVMDNSVFWLGSDGIVYRANGYTPVRISTHAIEQAIARCNISQSFAFTWEDGGHKVFYLTFPDGHTWGYDAATGEWHRRKSDGLERWRINALVRWNGVWIAGDYTNGLLYQLDWHTQSENGASMERRRVTGVTHDNQNALIINALELVVDTGNPESDYAGLLVKPVTVSGDLPDGTQGDVVSFTYTRTGGVLPVALSIASGSLPAGLSMSTAGVVTGTRTSHGTSTWTVRATDALGHTFDLPDTCVTATTDITVFNTISDGLTQSTSCVNVSNGIIFIGAGNANAAYSTDRGVTWSDIAVTGVFPSASVATAIRFNGDWYAFGGGLAAKATGDTFSFASMANPPASVATNSAAILRGSLYVGDAQTSGTSGIYRMNTPGAAWTRIDFGISSKQVRYMLDTGTAYLFGTSNGDIIRSTDLVTFTKVLSVAGVLFTSMAKLGSTIIAAASNGNWYKSTNDGVTWSSAQTTPAMQFVCATPSMFLGGYQDHIYTSPNSTTWTDSGQTDINHFLDGGASSDGTLAAFPRANPMVTVGHT